MTTYYTPSPHSSMHGHQPGMYSGSHQSYGNGYLSPQPQYGNSYGHGAPVVVAPSSGSRHHVSTICIKYLISSLTQSNQHGSHRRHGHSRPRPHHHHHHRTLGERILGWFGIRRHRSSHRRSPKGWSFFGNNRHRARYIDARTGLEVDRQGRPVYKV
ncbi:hypothetical protein PILCRDRAFT_143929 [Piloderma croceum F 1598]|uniref:Uncharacterized protein n=1 Tax=Piloderma croceum (strain F 1598) TaxID=765440 RepID=A0A0C3CM26_PILCF|nr:hypothetical protein PILCRDRAFT_143929 [Piloderma croceum F 1598]